MTDITECPDCGGKGWIKRRNYLLNTGWNEETCGDCKGTGWIERQSDQLSAVLKKIQAEGKIMMEGHTDDDKVYLVKGKAL